jgi:very-short-patch-repair endonuclease
VTPLPFDLVTQRTIILNKSNFKSELWFIKFLDDVILNIDFRRNFPILNRFFADFYFDKLKLVIEIDGKSHDDSKEYDDKRDALFRKRSLTVIRIKHGDATKAKEVINNIVSTYSGYRPNKKRKVKYSEPKKLKKNGKKNKIPGVGKYWYLRNKAVQESMNKSMLDALKK